TLSDEIPADIRVDSITSSTSATPRWNDCAVTGRLSNGYGGTLTCELSAALAPGDAAPVVVLGVTLSPTSTRTSVTNVAVVDWARAADPTDTGQASDPATVDVVAQAGPAPTPSPTPTPRPNPPTPTPTPTPTPGQRPLPSTGSGITGKVVPLATVL